MASGAALERMLRMGEGWRRVGDRRGIFLEAYSTMTERMHESLESGDFTDRLWVERLLDHFAEYYFRATEAFEQHDPALPEPWRIAFSAAERSELNVLQHLFLGINAHINYDLVFTLVDVLDPEWAELSGDGRRVRQDDYRRVNDVIRLTIDEVQDEVVGERSPLLEFIDGVLGPLDEWFFAHLIAEWREDVWHNARLILDASDRAGPAKLAARVAVERSRLFLT